jgi:hypothetical protein
LSFGVAPVCAVGVRVEQFPDGEAVGSLLVAVTVGDPVKVPLDASDVLPLVVDGWAE